MCVAHAMAVIHGEAGLGKTYAVDDAVATVQVPVVWTSFPSRPTPKMVATTLLEALTGRATRLHRTRATSRLVELLADRDRLLVIDESQLLTGACLELLRYLHDQPTTRFGLLLVGGNGTWQVLSREPMLASRIFRRVRFPPLRREEILEQLPAYQALYTGCPVDGVFAHGNLRYWAAFTLSARQLAAEVRRPVVENSQLTGRTDFAVDAPLGELPAEMVEELLVAASVSSSGEDSRPAAASCGRRGSGAPVSSDYLSFAAAGIVRQRRCR